MSYFFVAATPGVTAALQQLRMAASAAQTIGSGGALGGASFVAAGASVALIAGDSTPRPLPVTPSPFEGISRFVASASAVIDAATADPKTAALVVGLPEDVSSTTAADVDPLDRLADVLRAWDGVAPLEIGGFVFESLSSVDGASVVKVTIKTERVSDIIRMAREVRFAFPSTIRIVTVITDPDTLGKAMLRWGHRYHDELFAELKGQQERICAINDKLKRGESLSYEDKGLLHAIIRKIQAQTNAMAVDLDILKTLLYKTDERTAQVFHGVVHDVNPRLGYLQLFGIPVVQLEAGAVLGEGELLLLDKFNQVSLDYAVRYAAALAKLDLKNGVLLLEIDVGGLDVELVRQEDFDVVTDVLANLISNASRYSDSKKEKRIIRVFARREEDGFAIEVLDNGIGIPEEKLKKLGQYKFRVGEKDVEGSQGVGLWHVLKHLEELGWGKLWVKSIHGEGSSFRFVIPDQALRYSRDKPLLAAPVLDSAQHPSTGFHEVGSYHE